MQKHPFILHPLGTGAGVAATALVAAAALSPVAQAQPVGGDGFASGSAVAAIVKVPQPWYAPRLVVTRKMRDTVAQYRALPGLAHKAFSFAQAGGRRSRWAGDSQRALAADRQVLGLLRRYFVLTDGGRRGHISLWRDPASARQWWHGMQGGPGADLGSFRGESAFATWVWRVAHNHLMTARTRSAEAPHVSLEGLAERLGLGVEMAAHLAQSQAAPALLTPEDKLEARQMALACTQTMLMTLDREQRLIYLLDTVFDLPSKEAAAVVGITPEAYRQRLSRNRARMDAFMARNCGLANRDAACACERQLPAARHARSAGLTGKAAVMALHTQQMQEAERHFAAFSRVSDAAAVFRAHPNYRAPEALRAAIRAVLTQEGFMQRERPQ